MFAGTIAVAYCVRLSILEADRKRQRALKNARAQALAQAKALEKHE